MLPLSHCTAAELAAISHVLTRVSLDAPWDERTPIPRRSGLTRDGHRTALERLLAQRMPQLRELELNLSDWPRGLRVLGSFPALTSLQVTLGPTGKLEAIDTGFPFYSASAIFYTKCCIHGCPARVGRLLLQQWGCILLMGTCITSNLCAALYPLLQGTSPHPRARRR